MDEGTGNIALEVLRDVDLGPVLAAIIVALLLVTGVWLFNNYLLPIFTRDLAPKRVARFRQRISVGSWLAYLLLLVYWILKAAPVIGGSILLLAAAIGWGLWRDMIEGAIFKLQARAAVGDQIRVGKQEGQITKCGLRHLTMETAEGRQLFLPYRELSAAGWEKSTLQTGLKARKFELRCSKGHRAQQLQEAVYRCPWVVADKPVLVNSVGPETYLVEATTLDQQSFEYLVEFLRKRFS